MAVRVVRRTTEAAAKASATRFGDALEKALGSEGGASLLLIDLDNLIENVVFLHNFTQVSRWIVPAKLESQHSLHL